MASGESCQQLRCPFHAYDPSKYGTRKSCSTSFQPEPKVIMQHFLHVHSADLTEKQFKRLKSVRRTDKTRGVEDKWLDYYRIIFPDAEILPSPFMSPTWPTNAIARRQEKVIKHESPVLKPSEILAVTRPTAAQSTQPFSDLLAALALKAEALGENAAMKLPANACSPEPIRTMLHIPPFEQVGASEPPNLPVAAAPIDSSNSICTATLAKTSTRPYANSAIEHGNETIMPKAKDIPANGYPHLPFRHPPERMPALAPFHPPDESYAAGGSADNFGLSSRIMARPRRGGGLDYIPVDSPHLPATVTPRDMLLHPRAHLYDGYLCPDADNPLSIVGSTTEEASDQTTNDLTMYDVWKYDVL